MIKGFPKKLNKQTKYWRDAEHLRFNVALAIDKPVVNLCNFVAKKIGVCPQTTIREAAMRGLIEIAQLTSVDISGVILTEIGEVVNQGQPSYQVEFKSQEKSPVGTRTD